VCRPRRQARRPARRSLPRPRCANSRPNVHGPASREISAEPTPRPVDSSLNERFGQLIDSTALRSLDREAKTRPLATPTRTRHLKLDELTSPGEPSDLPARISGKTPAEFPEPTPRLVATPTESQRNYLRVSALRPRCTRATRPCRSETPTVSQCGQPVSHVRPTRVAVRPPRAARATTPCRSAASPCRRCDADHFAVQGAHVSPCNRIFASS
jgi:hypothetical protein